jgi:hypothetical protein
MMVCQIEKEIEVYTPFRSPLLSSFFLGFTTMLEKKIESNAVPTELKTAFESSAILSKEIKEALKAGKSCAKQAKWIGLDEYGILLSTQLLVLLCLFVIFSSNKKNCETQMGQIMVETNSLIDKGKESGAIPKDGKVLSLDSEWHRVCAPEEAEKGKMFSLIFWHKSDENEKPSWGKQVSGCYCHLQWSERPLCHLVWRYCLQPRGLVL